MGNLDSAMSEGEINEKIMDYLSNFIKEHVSEDAVLTKFVVLFETIEPEDRFLAGYAAPGMKEWETIGMLDWALDYERSH